MWARLHKLDKVRPLPGGGGAIVVLEDGRTTSQVQRVPSLTTLVAIARVLNARRALDVKFDGKGEVRYSAIASPMPSFLSEAISRAGGSVADPSGDRVILPAQPAGVAALIDVAMSELAHHARGTVGAANLPATLKLLEQQRRAKPLDKDAQPELYWPAVLELAALAGEQTRRRGGRWIETRDLPVPFAIKLADGAVAHPAAVAQKIVEGQAEELLTEPEAPAKPDAT